MVTVDVLHGSQKRYVGITGDLERRLREHRASSHSGSLIGDFVLLHTETFPDHATARVRERYLKSGQGRAWLKERYPRS